MFYYVTAAPTSTDLPMTMTYGDAWPASYAETVLIGFWYQKAITAPGATSATTVSTFAATYRPMAELTGDVVPLLSRPTALKVGTADASMPQTATGETPTFSWTAPSLGAPTRYTVSVYRLINQGGATVATVSGTFAVTGTSVKIPPGFIHTGESYMLGLRAQIIPGYDPGKPFATPQRYEMADTITDILTP